MCLCMCLCKCIISGMLERGVESVVEVCWIFVSCCCCCCFYLEEMRKEWLWSWSLVVVLLMEGVGYCRNKEKR